MTLSGQRFAAAVEGVKERPGLVSLYLFGSEAAGSAHRDSDVDLGALLDWAAFPGARERFEERLALAARLSEALPGRTVDLLVLNDTPPLLARRIVTEGRRLHCADREADRRFVRDVQLRAADLLPFLGRTRRLKLTALKR